MSAGLLELLLMAGAALVLMAGKAENLAAMIVRCLMVIALSGSAIVVWALERYWS